MLFLEKVDLFVYFLGKMAFFLHFLGESRLFYVPFLEKVEVLCSHTRCKTNLRWSGGMVRPSGVARFAEGGASRAQGFTSGGQVYLREPKINYFSLN